jgi:hypothetical protein
MPRARQITPLWIKPELAQLVKAAPDGPADAALVYFCPDLHFLDGEDLLRALPDCDRHTVHFCARSGVPKTRSMRPRASGGRTE